MKTRVVGGLGLAPVTTASKATTCTAPHPSLDPLAVPGGPFPTVGQTLTHDPAPRDPFPCSPAPGAPGLEATPPQEAQS